MFIDVKGFVLITVALKALEHVMIFSRVAMKMKSPVHKAGCCFPSRTYNTVPTERLGYADPRCRQEQD
jgi:hypothetical protein